MDRNNRFKWILLAALNLAGWGVLSLHQTTTAAPRESNEPFANAVEQRAEMIVQLKEISSLLKEQNVLLKSGRLSVVVAPPPPP
jgi:hypothetical protein